MQFSPAAKRRTICLVASLVAAQAANAQILGPGLGGRITEPIGRGIEEPLERLPNPQDALDPQKALERGEELAESVRGSAEETLDAAEDTASALGDDVGGVLAAALERFVPGVDRNGRRAENEVWVVLVPSEHADNIPAWGFTIRERRDLEALDRILLRIEAPDDRDIVQLGFELDADAPGTVVDFNHLYGGAQARGATSLQRNRRGNSGTSAEGVARGTPATDDAQALTVARAVTIGIIDTAVAREHEALRGAAVIERDFVPFVGERPKRHGTAVSSVALATARSLGAAPDDVALYAACVFFDDDRGNATAATGSLVAALEWLGNAEVPVVNLSLTGPPNRVLEAALGALTARGVLVFAAVGNDGPHAPPLYPAAYADVIGITAVDADDRIYRRANRGPQVAFAAPGVRVAVARESGGYMRESGTSMAAPFAAAVAATGGWRAADGDAQTLRERLEQAAIDLGERGFDDTFGHGRIVPVSP
jgi:subtilisin family serine protease